MAQITHTTATATKVRAHQRCKEPFPDENITLNWTPTALAVTKALATGQYTAGSPQPPARESREGSQDSAEAGKQARAKFRRIATHWYRRVR